MIDLKNIPYLKKKHKYGVQYQNSYEHKKNPTILPDVLEVYPALRLLDEDSFELITIAMVYIIDEGTFSRWIHDPNSVCMMLSQPAFPGASMVVTSIVSMPGIAYVHEEGHDDQFAYGSTEIPTRKINAMIVPFENLNALGGITDEYAETLLHLMSSDYIPTEDDVAAVSNRNLFIDGCGGKFIECLARQLESAGR